MQLDTEHLMASQVRRMEVKGKALKNLSGINEITENPPSKKTEMPDLDREEIQYQDKNIFEVLYIKYLSTYDWTFSIRALSLS